MAQDVNNGKNCAVGKKGGILPCLYFQLNLSLKLKNVKKKKKKTGLKPTPKKIRKENQKEKNVLKPKSSKQKGRLNPNKLRYHQHECLE